MPRKVSVTQALVTQQNTLISIEGTLTAVGQLANENEFGMLAAARQGFLSCCSEWAGEANSRAMEHFERAAWCA